MKLSKPPLMECGGKRSASPRWLACPGNGHKPRRRHCFPAHSTSLLLVAIALNAELFPAPMRAAPALPPGHELFADGRVRTFKIDLTESALATLKKNERAYVQATVTEG